MRYASCDRCGKSFEHCGFCTWCKCGRHWCSKECSEADGFHIDDELLWVLESINACFVCNYCPQTGKEEGYGQGK
jgi:hypothetical protein